MKKLQILTLTILLTSAFFTACSLKDEKDYEAKKNSIGAVWGSFEMWSGRS